MILGLILEEVIMFKKVLLYILLFILFCITNSSALILAWNAPNPQEAVVGYNVYIGFSKYLSESDLKYSTADTYIILNDLLTNRGYYFGVTRYDKDMIESPMSEVIYYYVKKPRK